MLLLTPQNWQNYQLLDCGGFEKLERFGRFVLRRPEPQAIWDKSLPLVDWERADAFFSKDKGSLEKGQWLLAKGMDERWFINYKHGQIDVQLKLALSSFKHVGLFPEQAANWDYINQKIRAMPVAKPKVLNLFAYTGGASIVAKQAGADVTHVDSVKQVISWSKENMEASGLSDIRWVVEDAMKFVRREAKRGNRYNGLILDPPAYGRGPEGEKWQLEDQINEMLKVCAELLDDQHFFFIINLYSLGFSAIIVDNLVKSSFGQVPNAEYGELYLPDNAQKRLPLGVFYRFSSV